MIPSHSAQDVASLLEYQAEQIPENVFILMRDVTETYAGLNARANEFAHGLVSLGVTPRAMVAVMLPNVREYIFTRFAIHKLGAIEASINTTFADPVSPTCSISVKREPWWWMRALWGK